jgi:PTH2 family peptidyl-tRNA hydrolase
MKRIKQVIVIRKDLKMRRGKEIAQGSHASMSFLTDRIAKAPSATQQVSIEIKNVEREWLTHGMAKICVQANSEAELLELYQKALNATLEVHLIRDSGKTEFDGNPTLTALAIGPDEEGAINLITGHLPLY